LLYHVLNSLHNLAASHNEIKALTAEIVEQVAPVIEQVSNGAIGSLLGIKKG